MNIKVGCTDDRCGWRGDDSEILTAPNPFDSGDFLQGCPRCREVNAIRTVCDEPGCREFVSMGTPTESGYRSTCYKHRPPSPFALLAEEK